MLGGKQVGSMSMVGMIGAFALTLAGFYVKYSLGLTSNSIKQSKLNNARSDAVLSNISSLALLRGMVNPSSGTALHPYEPALYASNYFSDKWTLEKNANIATKAVPSATGITLPTFASTLPVDGPDGATQYFREGAHSSQIAGMNVTKHLVVLKQNYNKVFPYWVESIDVKAVNSAKTNVNPGSASEIDVASVGRIRLLPPEPGPIKVEIKPESGLSFGTNFGSGASPLPPGNYVFRVTGSGVTYYAKISGSDGTEVILGLKDGIITHSANNIMARNVEIGVSEPIPLGTTVEDAIEVTKTTAVNAVAPATSGPGSSPTLVMDSSCHVQFGSGNPVYENASVPTSSVSAATIPTSITARVITTLTPAVVTYRIAAFGVNGQEAPSSAAAFDKLIYVTNTVAKASTTTAELATTTGSSTNTEGPGYDGNNCHSMCPTTSDQSMDPANFWATMRHASSGSSDRHLVDFYEPGRSEGGLQQGLGVKGVVCGNLELVADKIEADTGLANVADLMNGGATQAQWDSFDRDWGGGEAKPLERFYAYTAPSCSRQFIGGRSACGCFEESTAIRMADGSERPAASIRSGDLLWNPRTSAAGRVKRVIAGPEKLPLYAIKIAGNTVHVTNGHPFLTKQGLVAAKDLKIGSIVIDAQDETAVEAIGVEETQDVSTLPNVWNFELEGESDDDHYVLANGIMTGDLFLQIKLQSQLQK